MESSSAQLSKEKKPYSGTPIKPLPPTTAPSSSKSAPSEQIGTPEKPVELPRRARNRSLVFSVKEVKKIAIGLQRSNKEPADQKELARSDNDLLSAEEQIGVGSSTDQVRKHLKAKSQIKLPEKYGMLAEFFNCMETSIRLLRLKGYMSTFSKICPQVESLTDRRFTYQHLAQLKYILPEAICLKKVLLRDETTCCMKPDLQITLQIDAFGNGVNQKKESLYSILRKVFRARLLEFSAEHPEEDDVPEEDLPEPFNQTKPNIFPKMTKNLAPNSVSSGIGLSSSNISRQQNAIPSHMSRYFQRRFSQKVIIPDAEKTPLTCFGNESSKEESHSSTIPSPIKCASKPPISKMSFFSYSPNRLPLPIPHATQEDSAEESMKIDDCSAKEWDISEGTPAKLISTPARLMSTTPQLQTPKRCCPSTNNDHTPVKSVRRPTRTKLFPTPVKNAKVEAEKTETMVDDDDVLRFLPKTLLQSIREKERKAMVDQEAGVAEAKRRQQMIACLPKLFDMVLLIFQSVKCSVITKQELMHKIIASHCDIVDRNEVEEQLNLLQELVPDWISGRMASSGDFLLCVNKLSSSESIRRRLAEAE